MCKSTTQFKFQCSPHFLIPSWQIFCLLSFSREPMKNMCKNNQEGWRDGSFGFKVSYNILVLFFLMPYKLWALLWKWLTSHPSIQERYINNVVYKKIDNLLIRAVFTNKWRRATFIDGLPSDFLVSLKVKLNFSYLINHCCFLARPLMLSE